MGRLLTGVLPLLLLGIFLLSDNYMARKRLVLFDNLEKALLAASYVQGWVEGNINTLDAFAASNEIQHGSLRDINGLIRRQMPVHADWEDLFVTDNSGQVVASYLQPSSTPIVLKRPFFVRVKTTLRPTVSNSFISPISGRTVVVIAYPILKQHHFQGIVAVAVLPQKIQAVFSRDVEGPRTTISLWGSDHTLIAQSRASETMLGHQYPGYVLTQISSRQRGTLTGENPLTHQADLLGFSSVDSIPWHVIASTPVTVAMAPVYSRILLFIIVSIILIGVTLCWICLSTNHFGQQVALLAQRAQAISTGQYGPQLQLAVGGEMETLAQALNQMAAELAVVERIKADFFDLASHELRTPITALKTSLDMLSTDMIAPETPQYEEVLTIAQRQIKQLQMMVENILSMSHVQAGNLAVAPVPMQLHALVMTALGPCEAQLHQRELRLTVDVPDSIRVLADPPKITLALMNLLDNAQKFTKEGGITIQATTEETHAIVTVTDTGVGFSRATRQRLFTPFHQEEPVRTRHVGGAGLGLAVVKALVEAHGGQVFATSEGPGTGSAFAFTLPLA